MRTIEHVFPNGKRLRQSVIGVCKFDILNPCFNSAWSKEYGPGKHWGGPDACPACIEEARKRGK